MAKEITSGRPPMFKTPEDLQKKIDEYFKTGVKKRTITGLALFLGFESRQSFYDLKKKKRV